MQVAIKKISTTSALHIVSSKNKLAEAVLQAVIKKIAAASVLLQEAKLVVQQSTKLAALTVAALQAAKTNKNQ